MIRKEVFLVLMIGITVMLMPFSVTKAEAQDFMCTVEMAGSGIWGPYIRLTDTAASPEFENEWFTCPGSHYKEMLAVALVAKVNNLSVEVNADLDAGDMPAIIGIYLAD